MTTVVDICNLALARIGDEATVSSIDPPEGSAQATHCARFYPMARDTLLDAYNWVFTVTRTSLNQLSAAPASGWLYAFVPPANSLGIIAMFLPGAVNDNNPQPFSLETLSDGTEVIYTNFLSPVCLFNKRATDPSVFPPLFVEALVWQVAGNLAGPVIKGSEGMKAAQQCYGMAASYLVKAMTNDAQQRKVTIPHVPSFMDVRGFSPMSDPEGGWIR